MPSGEKAAARPTTVTFVMIATAVPALGCGLAGSDPDGSGDPDPADGLTDPPSGVEESSGVGDTESDGGGGSLASLLATFPGSVDVEGSGVGSGVGSATTMTASAPFASVPMTTA